MSSDPLSYWLVVEGEPDLYELWLVMLELWEIKGLAFPSAPEALEWVEEFNAGRWRPQPPELAILDLASSSSTCHTSVVDVGRRMRQTPLLKETPIIITTAYKLTPQQEKSTLEGSGADRLLYKPLPKFTEVRRVLQDVIDSRPQNHRSHRTLLHRQLFAR
jgi:CheY-like chemotaxis protein